MSDSVRPHRRQPTRLRHPWDSPGKNTGVGCHFLLQCMKVKSESEVAQSCPTLSDPMDCSLPGSSIHGIFQARVLEWGAIAFSTPRTRGFHLFRAKTLLLWEHASLAVTWLHILSTPLGPPLISFFFLSELSVSGHHPALRRQQVLELVWRQVSISLTS